MAICQTHLRHFAKQHRSLSAVLKAINEAMHLSMQRDMFVSMVYAIIELDTEKLTLAGAGHELPFIYDPHRAGNHDVEPIKSPGMAIGMVAPEIFDAVIKDTSVHFGDEAALLLYTDGVTEAVNLEGDEYSRERLVETLRANGKKKSVQMILDTTLDTVS
ncbi:MAG: PP2C family protein-serine/threonine phosphatase [Lentimonas sp.]